MSVAGPSQVNCKDDIEIHHSAQNLITIRHANFEFSTLRTVGGVGFSDKQINR